LSQEHKSRKYEGKRGRSDEEPEHRVVSLSGSDGAEKQKGQSEGKGAHVGPGRGWNISARWHFSLDRQKRCLNLCANPRLRLEDAFIAFDIILLGGC
jgi:hypothetical protein